MAAGPAGAWEKSARGAGWVVLAAAAAHLVSLSVPFFQWDDPLYVTANPRVQAGGLSGLLRLWSSADAYDGKFLEFFPLRDTVYWALWQLFGKDPLPFHATNIAFHALASALVHRLGLKLGLPGKAALFGALLFAVHPVHVESVAWVAGLKDPLATSLLLGATLAWLRYRDDRPRALRPAELALALALFVAALLVKSVAIAFPVLLVAIERLVRPVSDWRLVARRVWGPAVISALFAAQFVLIGRASGVITPPHGGSWPSHAVLMGWAFVRYLQQAVAPLSLRLHYCFEPPEWPLDPRMLGIAAVAGGVGAGLAWAWRRDPALALLGAWFFTWLLPVANLVPFPSIMADRYLYAPTVGSCLLVATVLVRLERRGALWLLPVLAVGYGAMSVGRELAWREERTLWGELADDPACERDDLVTSPVIYLQNAGLAQTPAQALELWRKALEHKSFGRLRPDDQCPELSRGARAALLAGDQASALRWSERAIATCPHQSHAWTSRLWALRASGSAEDLPRAVAAARRAHRLAPSADTLWDRGLARVAAGEPQGADDLAGAAAQSPLEHCPALLDWLSGAPPELVARVSAQQQACLAPQGG